MTKEELTKEEKIKYILDKWVEGGAEITVCEEEVRPSKYSIGYCESVSLIEDCLDEYGDDATATTRVNIYEILYNPTSNIWEVFFCYDSMHLLHKPESVLAPCPIDYIYQELMKDD